MNSPYQSTLARPRENRLQSHTPSHNNNKNNTHQSRSLAKPIILPSIPSSMVAPLTNLPYQRYYYLGRGNNHELIKRILQNRKNWVQTNCSSEFIHFKWVQSSYNFKFHTLGKQVICINHFQSHKQISNKQKLHQNLMNFCEANKMNVYNYLPVTFSIDLNTGQEDLALHSFLKFYNRNIPEGYIKPKVNSIILPRNKFRFYPYMSPQQLNKKSHGNFYCKPHCTKMMFSKIAESSQQETDNKKPKIVSESSYLWILKPTFLNRGRGVVVFNDLVEFEKLIWKYFEGQGLEDYQDKNFEEKIEEKKKKNEQQNNQKDKNQQYMQCFIEEEKGEVKIYEITKTQAQKQMKKHEQKLINFEIKQLKCQQKITQKQKNKTSINFVKALEDNKLTNVNTNNTTQSNPSIKNKQRCLNFVVQKYIERPMLFNNYKFDIRIWALLTQNLEVYFFKEGYLRLSSKQYSTSSHDDPFIHLTNNSVQKYSQSYDNDSGNQYPLHQLRKHLPNQTYYVKIVEKIKEIVWLSFCSVRRKININSRKQCFELFGYDFMVDQSYKVWLIQVNTNPAIEEASPLLKVLLPRMIDDMFKLTIDKIFPTNIPTTNQSTKGKLQAVEEEVEQFPVPGYQNNQNMFELLGDLREGNNEKRFGKKLTFVHR